jgi:hypothetical protein
MSPPDFLYKKIKMGGQEGRTVELGGTKGREVKANRF